MCSDITLKCQCGEVRGVAEDVNPDRGNRIICMCDDCQNYIKYLNKEDEYLDQFGGTDIFQLTPSQIKIDHGLENIKSVKMTDKGILRWYAGCCNTPIANTMPSAKMPFSGIPHSFMDHSADEKTRDQVLGPVIAKLFGTFAKGEMPNDAHEKIPFWLYVRLIKFMLFSWIEGKAAPNPFFNEDGSPISKPDKC